MAAGDDVNDERPTVPFEATPGGAKHRRGRRAWTFIGIAAVVAAVLAATATVPGWQRTVALGAVVVGVVGLVAVKPLIKRAPKPADGDNRVDWGSALAGGSAVVLGRLIQSVGPESGGFWAFVATMFAGAFVAAAAALAADAWWRIRRASKRADESGQPVSERPNPRP